MIAAFGASEFGIRLDGAALISLRFYAANAFLAA